MPTFLGYKGLPKSHEAQARHRRGPYWHEVLLNLGNDTVAMDRQGSPWGRQAHSC